MSRWRAVRAGAVRTAWVLGLSWASVAAWASPTEQLHAFLSQAASARGDFTQTTPGARGANGASGKPLVAQGTFEFLRPGRFRWVYTTPYEQLIVSDGHSLYLYDKDLNQVTKKKLAGALPASPASILFGANDFEHDFTVSDDGSSEGVEWIRALPNAKDALFERIRIGFRDGLPAAMQLRDSFGQTTELRFDHVQRNAPLALAHFDFTPPKGVDVLEDQ